MLFTLLASQSFALNDSENKPLWIPQHVFICFAIWRLWHMSFVSFCASPSSCCCFSSASATVHSPHSFPRFSRRSIMPLALLGNVLFFFHSSPSLGGRLDRNSKSIPRNVHSGKIRLLKVVVFVLWQSFEITLRLRRVYIVATCKYLCVSCCELMLLSLCSCCYLWRASLYWA